MIRQFSLLLLRPSVLRGVALAAAAAGVLALCAGLPGLRSGLEESSADPLWRLVVSRPHEQERRVVLVDIDENSLARVGAWPWPRESVAALADALGRHGARAQVFDIAFPEARPGDAALAAAQARHPLHIGQLFALEPDAGRVGVLSGALDGFSCPASLQVAGGYVANTPQLAHGAGHITATHDTDGAVRRIAPILCHQKHAYPALALQGLGELAAPGGLQVEYRPGSGPFEPHGWLQLGKLGLSIPVDADGTSRIGYELPRSAFTAVSAADVLDGRVPAGLLDGAVALVGATAFGVGDTVPTPLFANAPGVEVHAQFMAGLLDGRLPYTPRAAPLLQAGFCVLTASVLVLLATRRRKRHAVVLPLAGVALALVAYVTHAVFLLQGGLWLGWLAPGLFALLAALGLASVEFALTRIERQRLYHNLSSYLPEQVAAQVALREPVGSIEAERREISVLFADLRNFSAYCEARPPEEAAALLHTFFTTAYRVVRAHGGVLEEFVGDAVMAIWNAPEACPRHPELALQAAEALVREMSGLLPEQAPPGLEPLAIGVGLETGNALVGSFGAAERRTHTALGETVTVAVRLQAMTVDLASPIVVGPGAAAQLPDAGLVSVGSFLLEGLQRPRTLYQPAPQVEVEEGGHGHIRLVA